jgi:hypothetical protein
MRTSYFLAIATLVLMLAAVPVHAIPLTITGYDLVNARISGTGGWGHVYTGTITPVGPGLADYSGGTGTMANGVVESDTGSIQLFDTPDHSIITVFFDGAFMVDTVEIFGGNTTSNAIPGEIDGMDVTIGSTTRTLLGQPFGTPNLFGTPRNDLFVLTGTPLDGLATNRITFSNVFENGCCGEYSIAEIRVYGTAAGPSVIPEPATFALLATGLAVLALRRRK